MAQNLNFGNLKVTKLRFRAKEHKSTSATNMRILRNKQAYSETPNGIVQTSITIVYQPDLPTF